MNKFHKLSVMDILQRARLTLGFTVVATGGWWLVPQLLGGTY